MKREKINIAFATDDNYVMPTVVAMTSLFENNPYEIDIYLLNIEGHLSQESREVITRVSERYNQHTHFVDVNETMLDGLPDTHLGLSAYLRILIPKILPSLEKILYLDVDIIVNGSISELYNTNIEGYQLAAITDQLTINTEFLNSIGFKLERPYINSGVLLMNLKAMREMDINQKIITYLDEHIDALQFVDQDIINIIFSDIRILAPKYNAVSVFWKIISTTRETLWSKREVAEAGLHPVIIHYTTLRRKPWLSTSTFVFRGRWYHYLSKTEFRGYKPSSHHIKPSTRIKCKLNIALNILVKSILSVKYWFDLRF